MRKTLFIFLALMLTACAAAPTQAPQPTPVPPTAQVIVATVLVPVEVTSAATPLPPPTLPPPTAVPPTTAATTQEATATTGAAVATGPIALDPKYNGPSYENITISTNKFSLNCQPKEILFDVYSTDVYITRTDLYFRLRDKHSTAPEPWALAGTMQTDGGSHFWMTLRGDQIKADLRKAQGWFDIQFVGINKLGQTTDNWHSEKITDLVSYSIDCP